MREACCWPERAAIVRHAGRGVTGTSSFAFVEPTPVPSPQTTHPTTTAARTFDDYREAVPIKPLVQPVYPPQALGDKPGRVTLGVRISVDEKGRVTEVVPAGLMLSLTGHHEDEFMAAIKAAVTQWLFRPAQIEHVELVQTGGISYTRVLGSENTDTHFELSFTFTATGEVVGGPAAR